MAERGIGDWFIGERRPVERGLGLQAGETRVGLAGMLKTMGMPTAFDPDTDFSGTTAADKLFISAVVHHGNIDAEEKGTEAAAATVAMRGQRTRRARELTVDRAFIFALRDLETSAVLFLGRITKPEVRSN